MLPFVDPGTVVKTASGTATAVGGAVSRFVQDAADLFKEAVVSVIVAVTSLGLVVLGIVVLWWMLVGSKQTSALLPLIAKAAGG